MQVQKQTATAPLENKKASTTVDLKALIATADSQAASPVNVFFVDDLGGLAMLHVQLQGVGNITHSKVKDPSPLLDKAEEELDAAFALVHFNSLDQVVSFEIFGVENMATCFETIIEEYHLEAYYQEILKLGEYSKVFLVKQ